MEREAVISFLHVQLLRVNFLKFGFSPIFFPPLLFVFLDRVAFRHIPSTLMVGFVSRFASQMNGGDLDLLL